MAQPTADILLTLDVNPNFISYQPVLASAAIYKGAALGFSGGYARQYVAGDLFAGFAENAITDATAVNGGSGVSVIIKGNVILAVAGAVVTDINKGVFVLDGQTFQYTNANSAQQIGRVIRFISAGLVLVDFSITTQASS